MPAFLSKVIDIASSPEPDEPSAKATRQVLEQFRPRKHPAHIQRAPLPYHNSEDLTSDEHAARPQSRPRNQEGLYRPGKQDWLSGQNEEQRSQRVEVYHSWHDQQRLSVGRPYPTYGTDKQEKQPSQNAFDVPTKTTSKPMLKRSAAEFEDHDGPVHAKRRRATKVTPLAIPGNQDLKRDEAEDSDFPPHAPRHPAQEAAPNSHGTLYTPEEDARLKQLKEIDRLPWKQIPAHFNGRSLGSLQVRYSTKLKHQERLASIASKPLQEVKSVNVPAFEARQPATAVGGVLSRPHIARRDSNKAATSEDVTNARPKRVRNSNAASVVDGYVSWAEVKARRHGNNDSDAKTADQKVEDDPPIDLRQQDQVFPSSTARLLRHRELGSTGRRAWTSARSVPDLLKNCIFDRFRHRQYYHGTSGDVVGLSWAPNGRHFAAGSIAISDHTSMQYNMQRNLLIGDVESNRVQELAEHHVRRPEVTKSNNPNALHSMRQTQDGRLFMTVAATGFSQDRLFTAGEDHMVRCYSVGNALDETRCRYNIEHPAAVDLLTVGPSHFVATACHAPSDSVRIFRCRDDYEQLHSFSPLQTESHMGLFPASLKWGMAPQHEYLIAAGFAAEHTLGETCLWDIVTGKSFRLDATTRNVFDLAWNPNASSSSIALVVASDASSLSLAKGMRSAIQCFAPNQRDGRRILAWQCPALDINDVLFCPYDEDLIAAGATDGNVYVWDRRFVGRSQAPLHVFRHGDSLNVLPHDRPREVTDTGVRFLSWGPTRSRLYSGSSDGVVRVWNPDRSEDNAAVSEITVSRSHQRSSIMSGVFTPDFRDLLIGTENGRIDVFSIGDNTRPKPFTLTTAPDDAEEVASPYEPSRELLDSQQIVLRPCGAMPFRQAVQGPNYCGPYLAPSAEDHLQADAAYEEAKSKQNEVSMRMSQAAIEEQDSLHTNDLEAAALQVIRAQASFVDLQDRAEFALLSQDKAEAFQQDLRSAERNRARLLASLDVDATPCKLSCEVFRQSEVLGEEVDDSGRAEVRIPGMMRLVSNVSSSTEAEDEKGCSSCTPQLSRKKSRSQPLCNSCVLKRKGLTARCSNCSKPARVDTESMHESSVSLCESCNFACFRCSKPAKISSGSRNVICGPCGLVWEGGVLGYELLGAGLSSIQRKQTTKHDEDSEESIGSDEIEHYASLWQS